MGYELDLKRIKPKNVKKSDKYSKQIYQFLKKNPHRSNVYYIQTQESYNEKTKEFEEKELEQISEQEYEQMSVKKTAEHTRAFIKVQDGCNQFCSYCIIPYARGRVRSRSIADVVSEVEQLAAAGYREVVLTGIHLSSYGLQENYNAEPDGTYLFRTSPPRKAPSTASSPINLAI